MKKYYIKPLAQTVELKMPTTLLIGSKDPEGIEKYLIDEEEVDYAYQLLTVSNKRKTFVKFNV